jgi:hypothetical protein
VSELPADMRVVFSNASQMLDEKDKWSKIYKEIFASRAR